MNLEYEDNKNKKPDINQDNEEQEIDRLLEETGNYKAKKNAEEPISALPIDDEDDETLVLSEDLYELVEDQEDEVIYEEFEQPIQIAEDEDEQTGLAKISFPPSDAEDEETHLMNDSQIELERLELMMQEGELNNDVIHSDDSNEVLDVSNIDVPNDTADLENLIGESLENYLMGFDENSIDEIEDDKAGLESELEVEELDIEEELDFEPVESKTDIFKEMSSEVMLERPIVQTEEDTSLAPQYDLLEEAPYYIEEKTSVHKDASSIINDIEQYKQDKGITNSFQSSARHLENESDHDLASEIKDDFNLETVEVEEEFEDPFAFVAEENEDTEIGDAIPDKISEDVDHMDDDTDSFNKLGSDVIRSSNKHDEQIIEENISLNDESIDDSLILKDSIKSSPSKLITDPESKIIKDKTTKISRLRSDILLEDQVGQTTEAFMLNEVKKADSKVIDKLNQATDFGILRFDEDEDFKLTETEIQKEMKARFGSAEGSKAERMIVQYTLMKQKFRKLQLAHKRVLDAMKKAKLYQQQMMPKTPKDLPNLEFGALYKPAEQVSGDFYDFINLDDNKWVVAIGDSAGHGIAPALIMTVTKKLLSVFIREGASIAEAMRKTNYYVTQNIPAATFITAVAGIVDLPNAQFNFVRAGHPAIILYNPKERGNEPIPHSPNGMALGMDGGRLFNKSLEEETIDLLPGDLIVMFTDGVFEISDMNRKRFGMKRFMNLIKDFGSGSVSFLMSKINNSLQEFRAGSTQDDDLSVICLKYLPK